MIALLAHDVTFFSNSGYKVYKLGAYTMKNMVPPFGTLNTRIIINNIEALQNHVARLSLLTTHVTPT